MAVVDKSCPERVRNCLPTAHRIAALVTHAREAGVLRDVPRELRPVVMAEWLARHREMLDPEPSLPVAVALSVKTARPWWRFWKGKAA